MEFFATTVIPVAGPHTEKKKYLIVVLGDFSFFVDACLCFWFCDFFFHCSALYWIPIPVFMKLSFFAAVSYWLKIATLYCH